MGNLLDLRAGEIDSNIRCLALIGWLIVVLKLLPEAFCYLLPLIISCGSGRPEQGCTQKEHRMYHVLHV